MFDEDMMDFKEALESILMGKKVRRIEWPDDGTYLIIIDDKIMIFKPEDGMAHPLIVSREDVLATDWVPYTGQN